MPSLRVNEKFCMGLSSHVDTYYENMMRWVRHVARIDIDLMHTWFFLGKEKTTWMRNSIWEDNIKVELREHIGKGVGCIHVVEHRDHCVALLNTNEIPIQVERRKLRRELGKHWLLKRESRPCDDFRQT
jgi:hypothetical protein